MYEYVFARVNEVFKLFNFVYFLVWVNSDVCVCNIVRFFFAVAAATVFAVSVVVFSKCYAASVMETVCGRLLENMS